ALPARLTRLRGMAALSRMSAAITPGAAVQWRALRLSSVRFVMAGAAAVGHLLVGAGEHFRWRLHALSAGYRIVGWRARQAQQAQVAEPRSPEPTATVGDAVADLGELDRGQVAAYRDLLTSLDDTRR